MPALLIDPTSLATFLLHSTTVPLAFTDHHILVFANAAFRALLGRSEDLAGTDLLELFAAPERPRIAAALRADGPPGSKCVVVAARLDGSSVDVELRFETMANAGAAVTAIFARDVTYQSRAAAQHNPAAYSDRLTGLANRVMFADRLLQASLAARRAATTFAVLKLDLDGFKAVNARYGHDAGDMALRRIGGRLLAGLRDTDTLARLSGGEFAVLLPALRTRATAAAVAHRLIEIVRQPVVLGTQEAVLGASIGIAIFPEHAEAVDDLVAAADSALYAAKRNGRGRFVWATPKSSTAAPVPLAWTPAHAIGVPEIDEQHEGLVSRLNDLGRAMRGGEDPAPFLAEVIDYTSFHFAAEERLMQACGYAGADAHRDMHRQLLGDLRGLRLAGDGVSAGSVLRYLQEWLLRHVDGADRDLADALRVCGVSSHDSVDRADH